MRIILLLSLHFFSSLLSFPPNETNISLSSMFLRLYWLGPGTDIRRENGTLRFASTDTNLQAVN